MKKLAIFDLDGTLLYTLEDLRDSVNFALSQFGYQQKSLAEVQASVGNGVGRLVRLCMPENTSDEDFERCFAVFKEHYAAHCCEKTRPYNGIVEALKSLKNKGIKIGIVSNKFHSAAVDVVEYYFKGLYDAVKGESEKCRRKPSPDGVLQLIEEFHCSKDETIMFGDSDVDLQTAINAEIQGVAVLWGFKNERFLRDFGAKLLISNPSEIPSFFKN